MRTPVATVMALTLILSVIVPVARPASHRVAPTYVTSSRENSGSSHAPPQDMDPQQQEPIGIPNTKGPQNIHFENLRRLSPDGKYLAYVTAKDYGMSNSSIWVSLHDASHEICIARGNTDDWVTNPVWSPKGKSIAYLKVVLSDRGERDVNYRFEMWSVDIDGTNRRLLIRDSRLHPILGLGGEADIEWTDDNSIAFDDARGTYRTRYTYDVERETIHWAGKVGPRPLDLTLSQTSDVPFFRQCDACWGKDTLGTCSGLTICSHGCYVTSTAMVFKYFDVDTDPGQLNHWLRDNGGYVDGCLLSGWAAIGYSPKVHSFVRIDGEDWGRLNYELDAGYPVIVRVSNLYGYHFVVATYRNGNTYYLNDPLASAENERTLAYYGNSFSGLRIFHGELPSGDDCFDPPVLIAPTDGSTLAEGESISLSWTDTGDEYYGEVWSESTQITTFGWQSATDKTIGPQQAGYTYSWRVKARQETEESAWSSIWTFTIPISLENNVWLPLITR
ncbi:MAG: C39 family peptidase [Anaerolineales bacterium]